MKENMRRFFTQIVKGRRIHLDYASATPVRKEVYRLMRPYFSDTWANPSALYEEGVTTRLAIETQRGLLAESLHVRAEDITFTSGGTESNNFAIFGLINSLYEEGRIYTDMEIITTRIEHPSILEVLILLEKRGIHITYAPLDGDGKIILEELSALLNTRTVLVSCAYVNSEIGVIQDIKKITRIVRAWNKLHRTRVCVHTDASQAPLWLSCMVDMLGVDLMTLDAGKCYGPKGVGVLIHRPTIKLLPIHLGGKQEHGMRAGTESTPLIVGCVHALILAQEHHAERNERVTKIREYFFSLLSSEIPEHIVNGSRNDRVANNVHISIPGIDTEYAVIVLDEHGVAASTKSACGTLQNTGSTVIRSITHDESRALSTLRFTLGEETTRQQIKKTVHILKRHCIRMDSKK